MLPAKPNNEWETDVLSTGEKHVASMRVFFHSFSFPAQASLQTDDTSTPFIWELCGEAHNALHIFTMPTGHAG